MRIVLLAALACLLAGPAPACGPRGHRLVAHLAESALEPAARSAVEGLLQESGNGRQSLADISTWADELRGSDPDLGRASARWHYVNIGESGCRYSAVRDCPAGNCVV